jgi:hypothetical protein
LPPWEACTFGSGKDAPASHEVEFCPRLRSRFQLGPGKWPMIGKIFLLKASDFQHVCPLLLFVDICWTSTHLQTI